MTRQTARRSTLEGFPQLIGLETKNFLRSCQPEVHYRGDLTLLLSQMDAVMHRYQLEGIAAPMIGVYKRVILFAQKNDEGISLTKEMVNPKLTWESLDLETDLESCPTVGNRMCPVIRPKTIEVQGRTVRGESFTWWAKGADARRILRLIDLLDGISIEDYLE